MKISSSMVIILLVSAIIVVATVGYFLLTLPREDNGVTVNVVYDQSCVKCPPTNPVVNSLKNNGINISSWMSYDYNSAEGRQLSEKYELERVPAIIMSQNLMNYDYAKQLFSAVNLTKVNDSYIIYLNPPYRNLSADRVVGIVDVYFINDSLCSRCYNVLVHKDILEQDFKVVFGSALVADINFPAGQEFVDRYNITAVPTFILTEDARYYPRLVQAWSTVGTIEPNGYFVFRNVSNIGLPYRNLTSGKIVEPVSG